MKKLITLLFTGFVISALHAQWNPNTDQNLLVTSPGDGGQFSRTTSDGKTYVCFWKQVAAPTNYELRVQILDQNGISQLGTDGLLLTNQLPMSTFSVAEGTAIDSSDNLYIAVTGTGTGNPVNVFKVTPQGTSVWPNGINVGDGFIPTVLPLSNGDIIVGQMPDNPQTYMKVQRYNAAGQPVWANPVNIVSDVAANKTAPADFFELPNNEIEIIFHKRIGFGTTSYLFAQKIDFNGNLIWSDGAKQISTKPTFYNTKYSGVVDGDVVYYGYSSGENNRFDSYLQRINSDGSLPWGVFGKDFDTNQTNFEKNMKIAFAPGSQVIWAISEYTSSGQGQTGEYIQKFDKNTGNRLLTDNAKQVFPISNNTMSSAGNLHLVNNNPYFVVQRKITQGLLLYSLNAVLLDANGDFTWSQQYIPMATFNGDKTHVNVLKPINNQAVIVFKEKRSADPAVNADIYAQNLILPASNLGTNDIVKTKDITLYPNPATDFIHVDGADDSHFVIYNAAGQLVKSGEMQKGEIAVHELVKGQYILKLKGQEKAMKFLKK
ncbi:T9SS type A sorting domain-containing protein [Chryseobacterium sp. 2TAF14]|uniref:T9SS type A sorting domain-containing protein n=1 Tax=Chryseobacterium sp. 2TAF14 TaxID=3233007 RepID=UPI003F90778D